MADTQPESDVVAPVTSSKDKSIAATIIGSHSVQHMYGQGFLVVIPAIYEAFGLNPFQVGLISTVRQSASGIASIGGGIIVDRFHRKRGVFLGLSLALMGVGYLLAGAAPTYLLILFALAFGQAAGSFWHPVAISLLSQRFPDRRGLLLSLHRSAGSIGDSAAPLAAGALLLVISWRAVLLGAFPLTLLVAAILWATLWGIGGSQSPTETVEEARPFREQLGDLKAVLRGKGLAALLVVAGVRGMGDRTLLLFLPLYLVEDLGVSSLSVGVHVALLTAMSIVSGPLLGGLSDRVGRRPVILGVMTASTIVAGLMVAFHQGIVLTALVALLGPFMFSINALTQAGAMDLAEGRKLEGSMIGLLWGNNALFGAFSPLVLGALAGVYGFQIVFIYTAVLYVVGTLAAFALPAGMGKRQPASP